MMNNYDEFEISYSSEKERTSIILGSAEEIAGWLIDIVEREGPVIITKIVGLPQ